MMELPSQTITEKKNRSIAVKNEVCGAIKVI